MTIKRYRKNVAAVIVNEHGKVFSCRRADKYRSWQLPQGGVDTGESLQQALYRELREEIGTTDLEIIGRLEHAICYDWPQERYHDGYHGQEQYYFLLRLGKNAKINLACSAHPEFDTYEWLTVDELISRLKDFRKDAYAAALKDLKAKYPGILI